MVLQYLLTSQYQVDVVFQSVATENDICPILVVNLGIKRS